MATKRRTPDGFGEFFLDEKDGAVFLTFQLDGMTLRDALEGVSKTKKTRKTKEALIGQHKNTTITDREHQEVKYEL